MIDESIEEYEFLNYPGQATTLMGLLKYPDDFSKTKGLNQLWYKDTSDSVRSNTGFNARQALLVGSPTPAEMFSFRIPLKHIFGFMEDYDKIIYGFRQQLTLTRSTDNDAIFRNDAAGEAKVTIDNISWFVPQVNAAL